MTFRLFSPFPMWITLAIIVAIFTSLQDILSKRLLINIKDAYIVTWGWWFFSVPFLWGCLLFKETAPVDGRFFLIVFIDTLLLVCAVICYIKAIQHSDLSLTVPLMSLTPALLLITSPLMLKEIPGGLGIAGVLLVVIGSYCLYYQKGRYGLFSPFKSLMHNKGSQYMLCVAVLFGITGNVDKAGVLYTSPFTWVLSINTALALALTFVVFKKKVRPFASIKNHWPLLVWLGFFNAIAALTQMTAVTMTQVPYLIAIKRTSVIMTSIYGLWILKEKGFLNRLIAILLMLLGGFLIGFS